MKKLKENKIWKKTIGFLRTSFFYQYYKKLLWQVSNFLNDSPSKDLFVIWVTGTNGKTTTASLIHQIVNNTVAKAALISTPYSLIWDKIVDHKKPRREFGVMNFQNMLAMARDNSCQIVVVEISSAWLKRLNYEWIQFDGAVLTNMTQDHVDDWSDFHDYLHQKKMLFKSVLKNDKQNKFAVFPKDDKIGRKRFDELAFDKKINFSVSSSGVVKAEDIKRYINGTSFSFSYLGKKYDVKTPLVGTFNVYNILAALSLAFQIWMSPEEAIIQVQKFSWVVWRMERFMHNDVNYFIDMAHSPDALDKTLQYLSNVKAWWKLIVVFGTPGNKNKAKRAQMWKIIERYGDVLIATDNEPDKENRLQILDDLTSEIKTKKEWETFFVIPERKFALKFATQIAKPHDIVLIAGRPRHHKQLTNLWKVSWDDMELLKKLLGIEWDK